jgi:competence protein ComEA
MNRLKRLFGWLACWVWWPLVGKSLAWGAALVVLAHIGSGAALGMARGRRAEPASTSTVDAAVNGEKALTASPKPSCSGSAAPSAGMTADGRVILNQATLEDLRKLKGVGPKRAAAILALRERLGGRFKSVRELLRVKGIGPRSLKRLEPLIVLDPG